MDELIAADGKTVIPINAAKDIATLQEALREAHRETKEMQRKTMGYDKAIQSHSKSLLSLLPCPSDETRPASKNKRGRKIKRHLGEKREKNGIHLSSGMGRTGTKFDHTAHEFSNVLGS